MGITVASVLGISRYQYNSRSKKISRILKDEQPCYRGEEVELNESKLRDYEFGTSDAFCKAILCLYASFDPKSFDTGNAVMIDNSWLSRRNSKNYHHFFPKSYLNKKGYENWQINSMMNITIVDDFLNKHRIRAKPPSVYMREYSRENGEIFDTMKSHLIDNLDTAGVWNDDYERFINARAKRVLAEIDKRLVPQL